MFIYKERIVPFLYPVVKIISERRKCMTRRRFRVSIKLRQKYSHRLMVRCLYHNVKIMISVN